MGSNKNSINLNVYGQWIRVASYSRAVIECVRHDFHCFLEQEKNDGALSAFEVKVRRSRYRPKDWRVLLKTGRSTLFWSGTGERRICFFNKAWVSYRFWNKKCDVFCDDKTVGYETLNLVLLSVMGESLDLKGMHRLHGFGFSIDGEGAIMLGPSGVGKSTLGMELLRRPAMQLLSDDTPLIVKNGRMKAFPLRIALKEKPNVGKKHLRKFPRVHHGFKYVVGGAFFKNQVQAESDVKWLILAQRSHRDAIECVGRWKAVWPILKWLVIGYETPQVWEMYLRLSPKEVFYKTRILLNRLRLAHQLISRTRVAKLTVSNQSSSASDSVVSFLSQKASLT
ncbi:MAG: hypothetical protein HY537_06605 [Deltaproteobacteria bacterium]|nr:hypothetical protein [Deltaproteobacteria bacterium]